ncbi:MAG: hypothetical protein R3E79_28350 [Caldilineaceae bacterium]
MRESAAEIQLFVDELGLTFPMLLQPDDDTLLNDEVCGSPHTLLVDPKGELVF